MKKQIIDGVEYKLPSSLTNFQKKMYVHLIQWKWKRISKDPGIYIHKNSKIEYDAILPHHVRNELPLLYTTILDDLKAHNKKFPFKLHTHFNHMASSQATNINLFLPILLNPKANSILAQIKNDFQSLAVNELYKGFRIEYWDGNSKHEQGLLGDHNAKSGTDADLAIAYYNKNGRLCLWLIEHKLTETEFTTCGGAKSKNRKEWHSCDVTFSDLLYSKKLCYYHDIRTFNYWMITEAHQTFFKNADSFRSCPFKGGLNQLWRNQLIGLELERTGKFSKVYFSVVKHADNHSLDNSIQLYQELIGNSKKFSVIDSSAIVTAALKSDDPDLKKWVDWYKKLYSIKEII